MTRRLAIALLVVVSVAGAYVASRRANPVDTGRVTRAAAAAASWLEGIQRADGAIADAENPLFETWETVLAASALLDHDGRTHSAAISKATAFLGANETADGLVCHNRRCRAVACVETSSEYVLLLARLPGGPPVEARLQALRSRREADGSYKVGNPDVREAPGFPSVSAFVLAAATGTGHAADDDTVNWLLSRQLPVGHWGDAWEYYAAPSYALWPAVRALAPLPTPAARDAVSRATRWLTSSQERDGAWRVDASARPRAPSAETHTALSLLALQAAHADEDAVQRGVAFLLDHQRADGSWDGGYFPIPSERYRKKEYIFATTRALTVLATWLRGRGAP